MMIDDDGVDLGLMIVIASFFCFLDVSIILVYKLVHLDVVFKDLKQKKIFF